ncbi:hypothetical protein [Bradyrhizobium sp.]|uniref:hypothetical protein n=1 Tax=Bradyrhizobium sp. TaxID=376 RepID=UPI0026341626|nr:hypothetical protein [Bradyrhizobium sp.]
MRSAGLAALVWILAVGSGWPQTPAPQAPQQLAPQAPAPPPAGTQPAAPENPGLFNEMGKALEKSLSILPTLKSPSETLDDLNAKTKDVVKDAGESLSRLAKPSSMVTGRIACPAAANGASDCRMAADRLCQSKGFKEGKSLSTDSVEACSAKVLIPGRTRKPDDCHTNNFVTRALCQ